MKKIIETIRDATYVVILPHISPDGDAVGSAFAISLLCQLLKVPALVLFEEKILIPAALEQLEYEIYNNQTYSQYICVAVDCGDMGRMGKRKEIFDNAVFTINIDHHATNDGYGDINLVQIDAAAACEIIFDLFCNAEIDITPTIAQFLFYGIITDTNRFMYASTTPKVLRTAAKLIELGANLDKINTEIFRNESENKLKLTSVAVARMKSYYGGKLRIMSITQEMTEKYPTEDNELEGLSAIPVNVRGTKAGVLIKEKDNNYRVSLRSKDDTDVAVIAAKWGGGGHKNAAGLKIDKGNMCLEMLIEKLAAEFDGML